MRDIDKVNVQPDLPAGDFSTWLRDIRHALLFEDGTEVDCGECDACCSSSQFIHIRPEETQTIGRIPEELLAAAPGLSVGNLVLGYDKDGCCPMLSGGGCSIYEDRPLTCRNYDCRVFTAAGVAAGGARSAITGRARRWKFSYPTDRDRDEHSAVKAAARFIREHAESFPEGKIPEDPSQLAIVAIKAYEVFLGNEAPAAKAEGSALDIVKANQIVDACRRFDAEKPASAP